jgi:methionine-rich copper-binding protein CopC
VIAVLGTVVIGPGSAAAHTDLDFTVPTDGALIGQPLTEVTVAFTQPVTLVGAGFEVLDGQGEITQPFVVTDDDAIFRLQIDPPIEAGEVGVRYEVTAQDGHVISGGFSFTVSVTTSVTTAPASVSTPTVPTTSAVPASTPVDTQAQITVASPDAGDDGNTGVFIAAALAIAVGAVAFLGFRRRFSP